MPVYIQSIIFDKHRWSKNMARLWIKQHMFKEIKIDETANFYRFRQVTPVKGAQFWMEKDAHGVEFVMMRV